MIRFLGLTFALLACMGSSQAALLSYSFNNGSAAVTSMDANLVSSGATASSFTAVTSGGGAVTTAAPNGEWRTGTIAVNVPAVYDKFTLTAGSLAFDVSGLEFKASRFSGSGILATGQVEYKIGSGAYVSAGDFAWNSLGSYSLPFAFKLNAGETVEFRFAYSMASFPPTFAGTAGVARIDDVVLNGSAVPEPASVAVFGGLGVLALVRRRRR